MVRPGIALRRGVAVAAAIAAAAGCSGGPPAPAAVRPADVADPLAAAGDSAASFSDRVSDAPAEISDAPAEISDSARIREEALIDDGRLDGVAISDPTDASNDAVSAAVSRPRARRWGSLDLEIAAGFRSDARVRWAGRSGIAAGARRCDGTASGFAGYEGRSVLRYFYVGRVTLRAAERVILGRGMGSYALSGMGPVRGGFVASPSFSRWYGFPGTAAAFEWKGWHADAAAIGRSGDENAFSPAVFWTSFSRATETGAAGVIAGLPARTVVAGAPGARSSAGDTDELRVVTLFASLRTGRIAASGEAARTGGRSFFAFRFAARGRDGGPAWSALFFDVPHASPLGASGLERVARNDRGARIDVACSFGAVRCDAWAAAGKTRSESRETEYRRFVLSLGAKKNASLWWQGALMYRNGYEAVYPSSPLELEIAGERERDLRLRAALGVRSGRSVHSSVRADVIPGLGGDPCGVVLLLVTEIESGRFDARIQTAAHALPAGRSATIWRPGAGPFECLAPLYGKGSDAAVRVGFRAMKTARFYLFYVSGWSGAARAYAGFEYHR